MADEKIAGELSEQRQQQQQQQQQQPAEAAERTGDRAEGRRRARRRGTRAAERPSAEAAQTDKPADKPADRPAEEAAEKPAERSAEKSAGKPADKSAAKPAGRSQERPAAAAGRAEKQALSRPAKSASGAARSAGRTAPERRTARSGGGAGASAAKRASGPSSARGGSGWNWREDLRQLAIVVIGVALTVGVQQWIGRIGASREERQVMQQVYEELQGNRKQLVLPDAAIRTDALETLRSSAAAVSRCDKALLRDIYFCYGSIHRREERMAGCVPSDDAATLDAQIGRTLAAIDKQYGFGR